MAKSSKYIGVSWNKRTQKWVASITVENRKSELGRFDSEDEAAKTYDRVAFRHNRKTNILKFKKI